MRSTLTICCCEGEAGCQVGVPNEADVLLSRRLELLQRFPRVVAGVKNVLIDEVCHPLA